MSKGLWDILLTPLFWIVTGGSSIVLSIIGNLLTPRVGRFGLQLMQARQTSTREKRIAYRRKVVFQQRHLEEIASEKLDVIFAVLISIVLFLMVAVCTNLPALLPLSGFGALLPSLNAPAPKWVVISVSLIRTVLTVIGFLLAYRKLASAIDDMSVIWDAEARETKGKDFLADHPSIKGVELQDFYDSWDRQKFGITSVEDGEVRGLVPPKGYVFTPEKTSPALESHSPLL